MKNHTRVDSRRSYSKELEIEGRRIGKVKEEEFAKIKNKLVFGEIKVNKVPKPRWEVNR